MSQTFNYISFGNRKFVEGAIDTIAMSRGRMFEYTPTDLTGALESLDGEATQFLQQIPTFLCSEIDDTHGAMTMAVKFGKVSALTPNSREVRARFTTLIDFGVLTFPDLDAALAVFGADRFQLYRTHWAVRLGDSKDIVEKLKRLRPVQSRLLPAEDFSEPEVSNVLPPSQQKTAVGEATSIESFLAALEKLKTEQGIETFFRGHDNARYQLTPSLLRKHENGSWKYMPREDRLCKELLIAHYDEFQADQSCFDRLVRMQHHGLPTRLLDISGNPLVALFFACYGDVNSEIDGEVVIFCVPSEKIKYYDSDTVSCLANLSNLTYKQKNDIDLNLSRAKFNTSESALKLLHHIKAEKTFFKNDIDPEHLRSIFCVKAKRTNTRIKSQSGAFLLFGHEAILNEGGQTGIEIARVTIRNKSRILEQLNRLNINVTTVYPSIEQTAVHIRDQDNSREVPW